MMEQGEWYTPTELRELPSLSQGQADEMVGETGTQRVWWGRTEDSPAVSGDPQRIRINWIGDVETVETDERIER